MAFYFVLITPKEIKLTYLNIGVSVFTGSLRDSDDSVRLNGNLKLGLQPTTRRGTLQVYIDPLGNVDTTTRYCF